MATEYVERRNGGYFVRDSRVSLDSVVYAFLRGESPEGIAESFPSLGLERIFGSLAFYIANREVVDRYLRRAKRSSRRCENRRGETIQGFTESLQKHAKLLMPPEHDAAAIPGGCRFQP
jgi:uncharacterized protein (DUF433 family)